MLKNRLLPYCLFLLEAELPILFYRLKLPANQNDIIYLWIITFPVI